MSSRGKPVTRQIRAERRKFAEELQAKYDALTLEEKIARLPPDGAKKQRARLTAMLEKQNAEKSANKEKPKKQQKSEQ